MNTRIIIHSFPSPSSYHYHSMTNRSYIDVYEILTIVIYNNTTCNVLPMSCVHIYSYSQYNTIEQYTLLQYHYYHNNIIVLQFNSTTIIINNMFSALCIVCTHMYV